MSSRSSETQEPNESRYVADVKLVRACLKGDQEAWRNLVDRYARLVFSIALKGGLSEQDAAEVSQNVFTNLFRKLSTLRDQKCLAAWLITTTRRECQHISMSFRYVAELGEFADEKMVLEDMVQIWEQQHLVREALGCLDPQSQKLLTALFLDASNPDYQEIARRLGVPVGSIGPMRARAFKKLEEALHSMGYDREE